MALLNVAASLSERTVQSVPNGEITQYGGNMEHDWRNFFVDLGGFADQAQGIQKVGDIYVTRVGNVVVATGHVGAGENVNLMVTPASKFNIDGIVVDENGNLSSTEDKYFSISFVAGKMVIKR